MLQTASQLIITKISIYTYLSICICYYYDCTVVIQNSSKVFWFVMEKSIETNVKLSKVTGGVKYDFKLKARWMIKDKDNYGHYIMVFT